MRVLWLAAALLLATLVWPRDVGPASAHGTQDQALLNDPACLATSLRATANSGGVLRQEFVPTGVGLQAVDVCLTMTSPTNVSLNIRSGSVAAPGPILITIPVTGVISGTRWVHFEFPYLLPTTPGNMYLLDLSGIPLFSWRGTCAQVGGACTTIDPDQYPAGILSGLPALGDFAFRTFKDVDGDGDTIGNQADNCPSTPNTSQLNNDREFIDQTPPKSLDDLTRAHGDPQGDECDANDDNDALTDAVENGGPPCASATAPTDPSAHDSDGDRVLDGAECALGSDPANPTSIPPVPPVGPDTDGDRLSDSFETSIGSNPSLGDSDGDKVKDGVEYKAYATHPLVLDTDGDFCDDGGEVGSVDVNTVVNAADLGQVAGSFGLMSDPDYHVNVDMDKNGVVNAGDLGLVASVFGPC